MGYDNEQFDVLPASLEEKDLKVNQRCFDEARRLIAYLQVNRKGMPAMLEPDRQQLLGTGETKNWEGYGNVHFIEDVTKPEDTRMRYSAPVIKNDTVYLRSLMKLCEHDNREIAGKALQLCKKAGIVEENAVGRPPRGMFSCPVMANGRSAPMNAVGRCAHLDDSKDCMMAGDSCPLHDGDGPACPIMKAGEGSPMDQWSGCAQLNKEGMCGLGDGEKNCALVKAEYADEDEMMEGKE